MGPNRTVTGETMRAGNMAVGEASPFTPPLPAYRALVKNGLWPWPIAHGNHSSHQTSTDGSPHKHVMVDVGCPVTQTLHHMSTDNTRYPAITPV